MKTSTNPPAVGTGLNTAAKYAALASAIASTGNFILGVSRFGGMTETGAVALQTLASAAIMVVFGIYLLDWEKKRDKWPGRLNDLTRKIAPVAISNAKYLRPEFSRFVILVYREYHRMALAEGRRELTKDFAKEIKHWERKMKQSESMFDGR